MTTPDRYKAAAREIVDAYLERGTPAVVAALRRHFPEPGGWTRLAEREVEIERLRDAYERTCRGMGYPTEPESQGDATPPEWAHALRRERDQAQRRLREALKIIDGCDPVYFKYAFLAKLLRETRAALADGGEK